MASSVISRFAALSTVSSIPARLAPSYPRGLVTRLSPRHFTSQPPRTPLPLRQVILRRFLPPSVKEILHKARAPSTALESGTVTKAPAGKMDSEAPVGPSAPGQLRYDDGPMIWVDCEMTGLNYETDRIIEIAVIITNGRLEPVDEGIEYVIQTPKEVLDRMDEWCTNQHGKTGLTAACIASPHTHDEVSRLVLEYIQRWVPEKGAALLAGSTVHADMRFLLRQMPEVMKHLSYRIVDVSSVKELCRRWYPTVRAREQSTRTGEATHRALDDIRASIRELKFYQENIFIPLEPVERKGEGESESAGPDAARKTAL